MDRAETEIILEPKNTQVILSSEKDDDNLDDLDDLDDCVEIRARQHHDSTEAGKYSYVARKHWIKAAWAGEMPDQARSDKNQLSNTRYGLAYECEGKDVSLRLMPEATVASNQDRMVAFLVAIYLGFQLDLPIQIKLSRANFQLLSGPETHRAAVAKIEQLSQTRPDDQALAQLTARLKTHATLDAVFPRAGIYHMELDPPRPPGPPGPHFPR